MISNDQNKLTLSALRSFDQVSYSAKSMFFCENSNNYTSAVDSWVASFSQRTLLKYFSVQ